MKRILATVAIATATAFSGAVQAADIRQPPPPVVKAPVYTPPPFSWTGFYIGANVGYGWSYGRGTLFPGGVAIRGDGDGFFGGGQVGYNWQAGNLVFGIETDFQGSAGDGDVRFAGGPRFGRTDNDWFGTIRGRIGYAFDRWMVYGTGGGAYTHNTLRAVAPFAFASTGATGWTWTAGGGVEAALWQNWSVKGEYLYLATPDKVPTPPGTRVTGDIDTHLFRVGLNYHF